MSRNPWLALPRKPAFVLAGDAAPIRAFNGYARPQHRIDLRFLPEPWSGRLTAPVMLLNLNPGIPTDPRAARNHAMWFKRPELRRAIRANLERRPQPYPFYHLDPHIAGSGGAKWWTRALGPLLRKVGAKRLSQRVCALEFFPYHSRNFQLFPATLESQLYTFDALRTVIEGGAVVVAMRGLSYWSVAVPELLDYRRRYTTINPRAASISPRNCPDGYDDVLAAISLTSPECLDDASC